MVIGIHSMPFPRQRGLTLTVCWCLAGKILVFYQCWESALPNKHFVPRQKTICAAWCVHCDFWSLCVLSWLSKTTPVSVVYGISFETGTSTSAGQKNFFVFKKQNLLNWTFSVMFLLSKLLHSFWACLFHFSWESFLLCEDKEVSVHHYSRKT